ncbi:unnamed protein product [Arabidopsis halleri]
MKDLLVLMESHPYKEIRSIIVYCKFQYETDMISKYLRDNNINSKSTNSNNTSSTQSGQKKKCYLIDCSKPGQKVAEGRVWSSNPTDTVHLKPLGPNASKVSVDVPLVGNAKVWKPSSEIQTIDDALGSLVAWPSDKLLFM